MEHRIVLPLRGEVQIVRHLTNGVQQFLMVIKVYRRRQVLGIYGWGDETIFVAKFLMGLTQVPECIGAIHGVIREVGRALRRRSVFLVVEYGDGGTWYILYHRKNGQWAIDELMMEVVVAHDAFEVSDEE
jgi:hypothetical protein